MTDIHRIIPEIVVPGRRLGRHVHFDEKSRQFRAKVTEEPLVSKTWQRAVPAFDQGDVGSCTGNASTGLCITEPNPLFTSGSTLAEPDALGVYTLATTLDDIDGSYPPDDTGSSGLAALKACVQKGYITGYRWGFGLSDALSILSHIGPCIIGVNWYDSFDDPDADGLIKIKSNATSRGGHEVELLAIDVENKLVGGINSWGPSWGKDGRFFLSWEDFDRLLKEDGDVACAALAPTEQPG